MNNLIKKIIEKHEGNEKTRGSQARFAEKIGANDGLVTKWVKGQSRPGIDYQRKIIHAYGLPDDYFNIEPAPGAEKKIDHLSRGELIKTIGALEKQIEIEGYLKEALKETATRLAADIKKIQESVEKIDRRCADYFRDTSPINR